jgi:hypothetical protein
MTQPTIPDDTYERLVRRADALNLTVEQLIVPLLERTTALGTAPSEPAASLSGEIGGPSSRRGSGMRRAGRVGIRRVHPR